MKNNNYNNFLGLGKTGFGQWFNDSTGITKRQEQKALDAITPHLIDASNRVVVELTDGQLIQAIPDATQSVDYPVVISVNGTQSILYAGQKPIPANAIYVMPYPTMVTAPVSDATQTPTATTSGGQQGVPNDSNTAYLLDSDFNNKFVRALVKGEIIPSNMGYVVDKDIIIEDTTQPAGQNQLALTAGADIPDNSKFIMVYPGKYGASMPNIMDAVKPNSSNTATIHSSMQTKTDGMGSGLGASKKPADYTWLIVGASIFVIGTVGFWAWKKGHLKTIHKMITKKK